MANERTLSSRLSEVDPEGHQFIKGLRLVAAYGIAVVLGALFDLFDPRDVECAAFPDVACGLGRYDAGADVVVVPEMTFSPSRSPEMRKFTALPFFPARPVRPIR